MKEEKKERKRKRERNLVLVNFVNSLGNQTSFFEVDKTSFNVILRKGRKVNEINKTK